MQLEEIVVYIQFWLSSKPDVWGFQNSFQAINVKHLDKYKVSQDNLFLCSFQKE